MSINTDGGLFTKRQFGSLHVIIALGDKKEKGKVFGDSFKDVLVLQLEYETLIKLSSSIFNCYWRQFFTTKTNKALFLKSLTRAIIKVKHSHLNQNVSLSALTLNFNRKCFRIEYDRNAACTCLDSWELSVFNLTINCWLIQVSHNGRETDGATMNTSLFVSLAIIKS